MRHAATLALFLLGASTGCRANELPGTPLALVTGASAPDAPPSAFPATKVRLVGRFDKSDLLGPRFAWSASGATVRFRGTELWAKLSDPSGQNGFQVVVDGRPTGTFTTTTNRDKYPLATGLAPGDHEVSFYKRTEAKIGEVQLLGFEPESSLLPPPPAPTRRIELIGDSITAGYGDEGGTPQCLYSPATENAYDAYGAIVARTFGADHVNVSWAGKTIGEMSVLWDRTLPARDTSTWDFSQYVPDVVVINLGTNNFGWSDPGPARFTDPYIKLVEKVRARYPNAHVFCVLGPMLADTYPAGKMQLSHARAYTKAAVDAFRAKGDERVYFLEIPTQDPNTAGCGFHPSLATHRKMAELLSSAIKSKLGW